MKRTTANPVLVAFSRHYEIAVWHRPEFPRGIVTSSGNNVFFRVVAETGDWHQVTLKCFEVAQVRAYRLEGLVK